MKGFEFVDLLAHFHRLILSENTGNAQELAEKLGISRSSLYRILDTIEDYGIEIKYSYKRNTYYYPHRNHVRIKISIAQLTDEEMDKEKMKNF